MCCQARVNTAEDFAKYLTTWDAARDHEAGVDRTAASRAKRKVSFFPDRDDPGLRNMFTSLPVDDATKVENAVRDIANELFPASADDGTTLQQRMADALVLMADRATGNADSSKSNRPTVVVICDEDSLRGRVEGAGQILDFGRVRRHATDIQRLALLTMYGGCIIDGCGCPTQLLEIHHLPAWDHGGLTNLDTMAPVCKNDHTRSHAEKWIYTPGPDGHIVITTPDGTVIPTRRPRKPRRSDTHGARRAAPDPMQSERATSGVPTTSSAGPRSLFDL